jgi:pectate lyase
MSELRSLASGDTPRVILISGTFETGTIPLEMGSNKTLRGVDKNATIKGGVLVIYQQNVIIQNLNIQGNGWGYLPEDAAACRYSHHVWFDHLNLWEGPDGNLDIIRAANYVTVSWCKIWYTDPNHGHRLSCLVSGGSTHGDTDMGKLNVTYHHNWFSDLIRERMPRCLFGKIHVFNNYYNVPGNNYCVGVGSYAGVLVEGNYFQNVKNPISFRDAGPCHITARDNIFDNCLGTMENGPLGVGAEPFPQTAPYSYTLDPTASIPTIVMNGAGPH